MIETSEEIVKYYTINTEENEESTKYIIEVKGQQTEELVTGKTLVIINGETKEFEEKIWINILLDKEATISEVELFEETNKDKVNQEILNLEKHIDFSEFE